LLNLSPRSADVKYLKINEPIAGKAMDVPAGLMNWKTIMNLQLLTMCGWTFSGDGILY